MPESNSIEIAINNHQRLLPINSARIRQLVLSALQTLEVSEAVLSLTFVDDRTLQSLNQKHLNHDWPTDIVTFDLSDDDDEGLSGELVISAEMAQNTANEKGTDPEGELGLYVVHGLLHLCGYDDHDEADIQVIRQREREVLEAAGWNSAY